MIIPPHRDYPIVDANSVATIDAMRPWMEAISEMVNFLEIAEGAGSPEGVVFAAQKKLYFNTTGAAGTFIYIKTTDATVNTGWVNIA
jgi:hypothetical protein